MLREIPEDPQSVAAIARAVGISSFHFIRQFEAVFGLTPHQYRIHARLEQARHLLAAGDQSVTDVCMEVGFSSLGSFSALFKQRLGATPSGYQRRRRAMVQVPGRVPPDLVPGCLSLLWSVPAAAAPQFSRSAAAVRLPDSR